MILKESYGVLGARGTLNLCVMQVEHRTLPDTPHPLVMRMSAEVRLSLDATVITWTEESLP